jgi:hypothetical protein
VGQRLILLENVVAIQICPLHPGNHMLPQKVLMNIGIDSFVDAMKSMGHFWLSITNTPRNICFRRALEKAEMQMLGSTMATRRSVKQWLLSG